MSSFEVTWIDIAILLVYLLGARLVFGWYFARKTRVSGSESYFLGGRDIRWPILDLSFYVSNMSGSTCVGSSGSVYANDNAVFNYAWLPALILIFSSCFRCRVTCAGRSSQHLFQELRYGREPRVAFSGFLLLASVFMDSAQQIPSWSAVAAQSPEYALSLSQSAER